MVTQGAAKRRGYAQRKHQGGPPLENTVSSASDTKEEHSPSTDCGPPAFKRTERGATDPGDFGAEEAMGIMPKEMDVLRGGMSTSAGCRAVYTMGHD